MLKFFFKTSLIIFLAVILSLGVDRLYRERYPDAGKLTFAKNLLPHPEIPEKYDIVKLGNSHAEDGLTFERYKVKSLSLASVAQSFEYDLAMLKMHSRQIKENAVIVIPVTPLSFSQKVPKPGDNLNMNYYDGRLSPFLIPHLKLGDYVQIQLLPFVRSGYVWREKHREEMEEMAMETYADEWKRKAKEKVSESQALPPTAVTDPETHAGATEIIKKPKVRSENPTFIVSEIQAELAARIEPTSERLTESARFMVEKWHGQDFGTEYFEANRKDLEAIVRYCLEKKWKPVLVTLPISQVLINNMGPDFMHQFVYDEVKKMQLTQVDYFDFGSRPELTQNKYLFSNADHLNRKGAAIVSYLLLEKLIEGEYLPKSADGYDYE